MPYVQRDDDGRIQRLGRLAEPGMAEFLEPTHPDIESFLSGSPGQEPSPAFRSLDAEFVRVLEDVVDALMQRGLLAITDLPPEARAKLMSRKSYRERVGGGLVMGDVDMDAAVGRFQFTTE